MPRHITPKRFRIEYTGLPVYEVRVIPADMLRAEENGPRFGITNPQTQAIAMTVMWLWAASVREGHLNDPWPEFRDKLVDYEKIGDAEPLDPTRPGEATPSPSLSGPLGLVGSTSTGGDEPSSTTPSS